MAITKQNRTIWALAAVIFLLLIGLVVRERKVGSVAVSAGQEDQFGDRVNTATVGAETSPNTASSGATDLLAIINKGAQCLHLSTRAENPVPLSVDNVFEAFQSELGPISHQADRWMRWDLRTADGKVRRLRLEITENDEGQIGRELHVFSVDAQGTATPQEIDPSIAVNPADDIINQMLKEGEVFDKERAAVALFPTGARIEYLEKNNQLTELQIYQGDHSFKCADLKKPEICQCL